MADNAEPIAQAPEPVADISSDALAAAFAEAKPYNPNPAPAPAVAPVEAAPAPAAEVSAPAAPVVAAVEPGAAAPAAPDYAAYLKEQFGVEAPEALKEKLTLAEQAETLKANQRTAQDVAFAALLADPKAGAQFVKLQTTDFAALAQENPEKLLERAYVQAHPELPVKLAKLEAKLEYDAKYGAASFDDPDDPAVQTAKLRLDYAVKTAVTTMESAKTAAREAVLASATPKAEGPSEAEVKYEAAQKAIGDAWASGVENVINAPGLELAYTVDGQEVKLAFDHKNPAFQEFIQAPVQWIEKAIGFNPENPTATNFDRLAEIGAWLTQPDVMLKNTLAVGKSSLGAVIPLTAAVNPINGAPQAPPGLVSSDDQIAAAIRAASGQNNRSSIYN